MKNKSKKIPGAILTDIESKEFRSLIKKVCGVNVPITEAVLLGSNLIQALELIKNNIQNENCGQT